MNTKDGRALTDADVDRLAQEAEAGVDLATWRPRHGKVLVTGATGRLGFAVLGAIDGAIAVTRQQWDLDQPAAAMDLLDEHQPDLVIHCAAMTDTEACAREPEVAERRNELATVWLADACKAHRARMIYVSTNEVFDGTKVGPYRAHGTAAEAYVQPRPINAYGRSKYQGELGAAAALDDLAIVRTAWLFGGGNDFPAKILRIAAAQPADMPIAVTEAETGSPTYAADLAHVLANMTRAFRPGTFHVVNSGTATRAEYARAILAIAGSEHQISAVKAWPRLSTPPANATLHSDFPLRPWQIALRAYLT